MSKVSHTFQKNQHIKARIESIASGGQGFCKQDGVSIFVDRGVPGDFAVLELYDVRKDFAHARIVDLIEPSTMRHEPPCKLFKMCGGCQWQHVIYEKQLELKTDIVKQVMKHIAGLNPEIVLPAFGAEYPLNYRNKVQFPVASPKNSTRILAGYYKEGSHELVNIKHCPVQPELLDYVLESVKFAAEDVGYTTYDEKSHTGFLRHINARYSFAHDQALVTLVVNAQASQFDSFQSSLKRLAAQLMKEVPPVLGVCVNFNPNRGNRIMGNNTVLVAGQDFIIEKLSSRHGAAPKILRDGLQFQLSPVSFFQVNSEQAVTLMDLVLDAVIDFCKQRQIERVPLIFDAFAGVASIALWVAPLAENVIAVEEVQAAVSDSEKIMKLNGISNVEARCGTVEAVFPQLLEEGKKPQIVILDPPRKGVDRDALLCTAQLGPDRIVYVSCNPATLARDLKILTENGYEAKSVRPVDLFPQTYHVESVTVLDKI